MILPVKFRSKIQIQITNHILRHTPRSQQIKALILKGWCEESAGILVDAFAPRYLCVFNKDEGEYCQIPCPYYERKKNPELCSLRRLKQ